MRAIIRLFLILSIVLVPAAAASAQGNITPGWKDNQHPQPVKPWLTVNGGRSASVAFPVGGGTQTLTIATNQKGATVTNLPAWLTQGGGGKTITLECAANSSDNPREVSLTVKAGGASVKVYVTQSAAKMGIVDMKFANSNGQGSIISDYGSWLYASDVRYLKPRLIYDGAATPKARVLSVKILDPNGNLLTNESSPSGYTFKKSVTFKPGKMNYLDLPAWGSSAAGTFNPGNYRVEIWSEGVKIYSGSINLSKRKGESTYLRVNNDHTVTTNVSNSGARCTYYVSTDCEDWRISGVPSYCEVTDQTPYEFTLLCYPNNGSPRSATIVVSSDNQQAKINLKQGYSGGGGSNAVQINRIWTDYDAVRNGESGMLIHIDFDAKGLRGHRLSPNVYFEYDDGSILRDTDGNYCTPDGQVAISGSADVASDDARWSNFELFVPVSQLHITRRGTVTIQYQIEIHDLTTGKRAAKSNYEAFTVTL